MSNASKRPRTSHFIAGLGNGNAMEEQQQANVDDLFFRLHGRGGIPVEQRRERLRGTAHRMAGNNNMNNNGNNVKGRILTIVPSTPSATLAARAASWQYSAMALIAIMGLLVTLFLHLITDHHTHFSSSSGAGGSKKKILSSTRRNHHHPSSRKRKKKIDEWNEDDDCFCPESESEIGCYGGDNEGSTASIDYHGAGATQVPGGTSNASSTTPATYYHTSIRDKKKPEYPKHRKVAAAAAAGQQSLTTTTHSSSNRNYYYTTDHGTTTGANVATTTASGTGPGIVASGSFRSPSSMTSHHYNSQIMMKPHHESNIVAASPKFASPVRKIPLVDLHHPYRHHPPVARPLSPVSSFASMGDATSAITTTSPDTPSGRHIVGNDKNSDHDDNDLVRLPYPPGISRSSGRNAPLPTQEGDTIDFQTPRAGTKRRVANVKRNDSESPSQDPAARLPSIPFMPNLIGDLATSAESSPWKQATGPPQSVSVEELQSRMESGSIQHDTGSDFLASFLDSDLPISNKQRQPVLLKNQTKASVSVTPPRIPPPPPPPPPRPKKPEQRTIPSDENDPRRNIHHKRSDLTHCTDTASSLLSSIRFEELQLEEVIGGGGFGQVWRAKWRSCPVAVKVLTGSAQRTQVRKEILQEFSGEIEMLKGMRHPNICLYMGACFDPPNRAIVTELAVNGSVWDALRLPLQPPYMVTDGVSRSGWPSSLYKPTLISTATSFSEKHVPLPARGKWPWVLVKRVASGAARAMCFLHAGSPPVLHRDLKSANLLLDESYTTKVCDFGLSRLKAQERSMTGNCGTVQWMAPEILANKRYAEPADVFSFGIILWELLTGECPYDGMSAIQCALAVLNKDHRPQIPSWCPPALKALIQICVKRDPSARPTFSQVILALDSME